MPKGDDMTEEKDTSKTTAEQSKSEMVFDDGRIESIQEFQSPEQLYRDLILRVRKYHPSDDISLIEKAYHVAYQAHKDQVRKSGEPYIVHPLCVAIILADLEMDKETIAAGLLHDVVEDTIMTLEQLTKELAQRNGVTEELKATDQMAWVQAMNNFKASAEEVVLRQLIYS